MSAVEEMLDAEAPEDAQVLRAVDARDAARHVEDARGDLARRKVSLVLTRRRHEHVGVLHARILLDGSGAAVAAQHHARSYKGLGQLIGARLVGFDEGHLVPVAQERAGQIRS